jgi:mRNA interferase MazF
MTGTLRAGDIFLCSFPFTSGGASKTRPVLLLFDFGADCLICRITSGPYDGALDVTVTQWRRAGLLKPSTARLSRLVTAEKSLLIKRIGRLADADLRAVRHAWNRNMRL